MSKATTLTPPSCTIGNKSAPDAIGNTVVSQDTNKAGELWRQGLQETGYTSADLTVIVTEEMEDIAKQFVQGIQGSIGKITTYGDDEKISFSLKLSVLSAEDFSTAFSKGDYDMALYRFETVNQNAVSFLSSMIDGNYLGEVDEVQSALEAAQSANADKMANACKECEQSIMNDYSIMPMMYESSYYVQAEGVSGVQFHAGSGRVNFVNATREN